MADRSDAPHSQLYLLRVWIAPGGEGAARWRGKLQPVLGEGSYCFAGASELLTLLARLLADEASDPVLNPAPTPPGLLTTEEA